MDTALLLLSAYPQGSESVDWECATPLSLAVRDSQEDIALHLINECPHALKLKDIRGVLPLETAIRNLTSLQLFSKMVLSWPEGCKCLLENIGNDENVSSWEWRKIELCLQAASGALETNPNINPTDKNPCNYRLLHTALELSSCSSLHYRVINTCKDLVLRRDGQGRYPLHIATKHKTECSLSVIEKLLDIYPEAASEKDSFCNLPLHIAISHQSNASIVMALLVANPPSATESCYSTCSNLVYGLPPLLLAIHCGCNMDTIYTLARFDPSFFVTKDYTRSVDFCMHNLCK